MTLFVLHLYVFFFNDTATTEIYTLSLHDALPISAASIFSDGFSGDRDKRWTAPNPARKTRRRKASAKKMRRSEEHTSELQSRQYLVCRLLLEKKKITELQLSAMLHLTAPSAGDSL